MKSSRIWIGVIVVLTLVLGSVVTAFAQSKLTIGVSIRSLSEERWAREKVLLEEKARELGVDVIFTDANNDEFVQNSQIENLIARGVDALIIISATATSPPAPWRWRPARASRSSHTTTSSTSDAIYGRLTVCASGTIAEAVVEQVPTGRYFWIGGSPTDDNAYLVRQGHFQVLQPLIDRGDIVLVGEQWSDAWSPEEALKHTENMLTAQGNRIDAIVASNDGTAGGAVQALAEQGLAGKVAISGQDADLVAVQRIAEGTQTVTIFKDVRILAATAMEAAVELAQGKRPSGINGQYRNEAKGVVQDAIFVDVIPVTKENLYEVIVKGGFHKLEDVYRNIPRDQWPSDN